ncbi:MAG: LysM peptidoglycan-binding domain-containing protein [Dehalococcoidia bacterium]|nr:LysM peptidoglycan-binding domain-containing protein [Dehalococcoidia bacterium]
MRIRRHVCVLVACLAAPLLLAACGGGSPNKAQDASVPTATLPATLPAPLLLGNGVAQSSGAATYIIKSGDTLAAIATRFGVSLTDLRAANPGINPGALTVGATVKLPGGTPQTPVATGTPPPPPPATYTPVPVAAADTPTPQPPPPTSTSAPATGRTYTVQAGDIPETIAQKFGVTVAALLAANPGLNPRNMQVGDVINIPAAGG